MDAAAVYDVLRVDVLHLHLLGDAASFDERNSGIDLQRSRPAQESNIRFSSPDQKWTVYYSVMIFSLDFLEIEKAKLWKAILRNDNSLR